MYISNIIQQTFQNFNLLVNCIYFVESSGFVYGAMSFVEKIAVGIAVVLVQIFMPNLPKENQVSIVYFKWILSFGCGGVFLFSLVLLTILMHINIGHRYRT